MRLAFFLIAEGQSAVDAQETGMWKSRAGDVGRWLPSFALMHRPMPGATGDMQ